MKNILASVAGEKLGFSYGKPIRVDEKMLAVVLPILRQTSLKRQYLTFPETENAPVFDTGKIDEMEIHNQTEENLFVRSGTLFRGSTQERALMRSAVVFPGKKQKLGVRCIHRSRGISANTKVGYGGITPLSFDSANYSEGYKPKDQASYWANVQKSTTAMNNAMGKMSGAAEKSELRSASSRRVFAHRMVPSNTTADYLMSSSLGNSTGVPGETGPAGIAGMPNSDEGPTAFFADASAFGGGPKTDDLFTTFSEFSTHFDDVLSKVKLVEHQAGLALINQNGVETIEFFDHKDSWKALHESAVKRLGSNIVSKDDESVFEYKPENAIKQVNRILAFDWKLNRIFEHRPSNGEPHVEITGLSFDRYVGEAVEVNGDLIHLVILRQSE